MPWTKNNIATDIKHFHTSQKENPFEPTCAWASVGGAPSQMEFKMRTKYTTKQRLENMHAPSLCTFFHLCHTELQENSIFTTLEGKVHQKDNPPPPNKNAMAP